MVAASPRLHRVPAEARGERLDQYLALIFPDLSRSRLKALIEDAQVTVSGLPAKTALRLKGGEEITLSIPAPVPVEAQAEDLPLRVLHQDKDIVVLDKTAGMVVHPAAGNWSGTVVNALLHQVKDLTGVGGELRPGIVHRLDKDTSGCLVVAKNEKALAELQRAFKAREVDKRYLALVSGKPKPAGEMDTFFGRHPKDRKRFTGKLHEGKRALTRYKVVEAFTDAALVEIELLTGRTHQIRVHFAEAGHPLLGDEVYGKSRKAKGVAAVAQEAIGRQALHAWKLAFPHPRTGKPMIFEAELPEDFQRGLELLRAG
ncbi:MAG: RluA family pseudouridine synthase [Myxococcaceae bacterium]